jgi:hypothetical protein
MVILPGIITSLTRIPPEDSFSAGNCQFIDDESNEGMVTLPGITHSGTKNPPEEWDSGENYKLVDEESTQGMGFRRELLSHGR